MMQKIVLIGAGNVAQHLAPALSTQEGYEIEAVFSRHIARAAALRQKLPQSTKAQSHLDFNQSKADLFILAVTDDALAEVAQRLITPPEALIVHTSGTRPMSVLSALAQPKGVFYPLQTFSVGKKVDFSEVPFCIEAARKTDEMRLVRLAKKLSKRVYLVDSEQRKSLHLAAVFANNFSNHLFGIAEEILQKANLSFELLHPLLKETAEKASNMSPTEAQTGPARRQDQEVIKKQLDLLQEKPHWQMLYKMLSEMIQEKYKG